MTWILPEGAWLQFEDFSSPVRVIRGIGSGSQGQVYEVVVQGEHLALKWYLPSWIRRDPHLERRLRESIRATAPNQHFLWPIALLKPTPASLPLIRCREPGFGYLMELRPRGFVGAIEHYAGRIDISLREILRASFFLAEAFHALHSRGLCYKDISLGNLFLDPGNGEILICDNDNVDVDGRDLGSVLGTPGFMAPEILMRQARPGADSDLFSLAVLIFRLLTRHDPLKGQMELEIHCLDEPARRHLYGEDPVFIFDPNDSRNRPDPELHRAALVTWPIYPKDLRDLFLQTFVTGMKRPNRRALTGQWQAGLAGSLDRRQQCESCGQENFGTQPGCWHCQAKLPLPTQLIAPHGSIVASPGNELHPHHFNCLEPPRLDVPLARIVSHPDNPGILGLRNLSGEPCQAQLNNGQSLYLAPQQTCNLAALRQLQTPLGHVRLQAGRPASPSLPSSQAAP